MDTMSQKRKIYFILFLNQLNFDQKSVFKTFQQRSINKRQSTQKRMQ